jgi:hypothetical protein
LRELEQFILEVGKGFFHFKTTKKNDCWRRNFLS